MMSSRFNEIHDELGSRELPHSTVLRTCIFAVNGTQYKKQHLAEVSHT